MILRARVAALLAAVTVATCATAARAQSAADSVSRVDSESTREMRCATCTRFRPLTLGEKTKFYTSRTFSVRTLLGASYAAGIAQWRGTPREWGAGLSGYARRDAAAYGGSVIRHTTEFGVGAMLHEDPRFEPSSRTGFIARSTDALHNAAFVRTDDGSRRFAWSRIAASLATGFAVNSWEPRRLHSTHHALALSLAGVASYGTGNVMREFTPDIKRFLLSRLGIADRM